MRWAGYRGDPQRLTGGAARHRARRVALLCLLLLLSAAGGKALARKYRKVRPVSYKGKIYLSFSFRSFFTKRLQRALTTGFQKTIYLEARVYRVGRKKPVYVAIRNCRVLYDLWNGSFRVSILDRSGSRRYRYNKLRDALKRIADVWLSIGKLARYRKGVMHYADIVILFAPLPPGFLRKVRRWLKYPPGPTPGTLRSDPRLGHTFSLFVNSRLSRALKELRFRTQRFWWPGP